MVSNRGQSRLIDQLVLGIHYSMFPNFIITLEYDYFSTPDIHIETLIQSSAEI